MPTRPNMRTLQMQDTIDRLVRERNGLRELLRRCYQSGHREGWEPSESVSEVMEDVVGYFFNVGESPVNAPKAVIPTERVRR